MQDIVIYGTGGVGRQAAQIIQDINTEGDEWRVLGYLDDDHLMVGAELLGLPVLGTIAWLSQFPLVNTVVAIGAPADRQRVVEHIKALGHDRFGTLIHPTAQIGRRCAVGGGTIIYPGVVVDTDVQIGAFSIVNKVSTIGHDAVVGDYVTLSPGVNLGGTTSIGEGCELGIGSATIQGVTIGEWAIVGAGAVVLDDLAPNVTAVGVPARVIKQRQPGWQLES